MPAPSVMQFGDTEVRVAADGTSVRLLRGRELVVELSWLGAVGAPADLIADDEVEHSLALAEARLMQRHSVADAWRSRWMLLRERGGTGAIDDRLRVEPGPQYALWSWGSGVSALLAICPAHAAGPVLELRLEQGYLEEDGDPELSSAAQRYLVAPAGAQLAVGERLVTVVAARWCERLADLYCRLPPWLDETQFDVGSQAMLDVADFGVTAPEGVEVEYVAGTVLIEGPAGRQVLDIQTPRGLSRVPLEWVPPLEQVLHRVADEASRQGIDNAAQALCLQRAADRHAVWLGPSAQDLLDRFDWAGDPTIHAPAFALARGRALGEAAMVSEGLRELARRPVGIGYGRVVMSGFLASLSVGLDAQERCLDLLGRSAVGRTAALESSLLHYRSVEVGQAEVAGIANRLGGLLPGEPPLLTWAELASLVGLLELCPPEWDGAADYAHVADKARGQVLCGYVDGRIDDAEPLAWLLLAPDLA